MSSDMKIRTKKAVDRGGNEVLRRQCERGLSSRFAQRIPEGYKERLDHELSVIGKLGFSKLGKRIRAGLSEDRIALRSFAALCSGSFLCAMKIFVELFRGLNRILCKTGPSLFERKVLFRR